TYDAGNNLSDRWWDGMGQDVHVDFTYTDRNQIETITRNADNVGPYTQPATTSYTYDALGRIENLHHVDVSSANIANYTYTYDAGGNLETEELNGTLTT